MIALLVVFTLFASQSTATACSDSPNPRYPCSSVKEHMCYSNSPWHDIVTEDCPATCGVCKSDCSDSSNPRYPCSSVTAQMCNTDSPFRDIVTQDCPATCGICESECVDTTPYCLPSNCEDQRIQDVVNKNCKKTCNRCSVSPTSVTTVSPGNTCTSYPPDTVPGCAGYARKGYCTMDFYHNADRRKYCATTCKIC